MLPNLSQTRNEASATTLCGTVNGKTCRMLSLIWPRFICSQSMKALEPKHPHSSFVRALRHPQSRKDRLLLPRKQERQHRTDALGPGGFRVLRILRFEISQVFAELPAFFDQPIAQRPRIWHCLR